MKTAPKFHRSEIESFIHGQHRLKRAVLSSPAFLDIGEGREHTYKAIPREDKTMNEKTVFLEARNKLQAEGWVYWFPPRVWGENDIMSIFDFIACKGKKIIFVQATTLQHLSDRRKKILEFYELNNVGPFKNVFIWAYDKKKGLFKIERQ